MSEFHKNSRKYRKQKKMTQNELGKIWGCGYTTVVYYENAGNEPTFEDLLKIAAALEVGVDELLSGVSQEKWE